MNTEIMTDIFLDEIRSIPISDIKHFFKAARQEQYERIRSSSEDNLPLTDIKARVILLDEMEQAFIEAKTKQRS
jgi:hypothetical protein